MATLQVTKVVTDTDMRGVHKLRAKVTCHSGQAWLFLNKAGTIARLVGPHNISGQGVWTYYAEKDRTWDREAIRHAVSMSSLRLVVPAFGEPKAGKGKLRRAA